MLCGNLSWRIFSNHDNNDDFTIRRSDGVWSYSFTVVIDDYFQNINRIVRGDDLSFSISRNRELQTMLGFSFPTILHVPIIKDSSGNKLSKHTGSEKIKGGINTKKQLLEAWHYLKVNMPQKWISEVSELFKKKFI